MHPSVIVLATLLISCHAFAYGGDERPYPDTYATGKLVGTLEKLRLMMQTGNASLGVPVLDPFNAEQLPIKFKEESLVEVDALLTNVNAVGLSSYEIEEGDFQVVGLKIAVKLSWPEITASTDYAGEGVLVDTAHFNGAGKITVAVKDLSIGVKLGLAVRSKKLYVRNVNLELGLGALDFKITGLYDDEDFSDLVSALVSDMAPSLVSDYQKEVTEFASEKITVILNEYLKDMTLSDLLGMIN